MLNKHWDHLSVYNMIMKLLITRGPISLIPREATHNRILSKAQNSFWFCSHMNCCLQNILYNNLHILYILQVKTSSKIQEKKFNKYIKSYQQNKLEFSKIIILFCISLEFQV